MKLFRPRTGGMRAAFLTFLGVLLTLIATGVQGVDESKKDQAHKTLSAIVKVKMKALAEARTSEYLGAEREGTGIVVDDRGYILTIGYIVIEADAIEVSTAEGKTVPATLAAYDHASGFALLHAAVPLGVKAIELGSAESLERADPVLIAPFGGREAARLAFVASRRQFTGAWEYLVESAIFTTPPIEEWAGSALIDGHGQLVGVGSLLVRNSSGTPHSLPGNMFVPIDLLKPILPDLIANGRAAGPARPWIGLGTEEVQGHLVVSRVSKDGPADAAGIRGGDIVVGVGEHEVASHAEFYREVWGLGGAGVEVPLRVLQGAKLKDMKLRSIDRVKYFRTKPAY